MPASDTSQLSLSISTDPSPTRPDGSPKRILPAELGWAIYAFGISIGVSSMMHSNLGFMPAGALPQVLNAAVPSISYSIFYVVFQIVLVTIVCIIRKTFDWRYLISLGICSIGGVLIDFHTSWITRFVPNDTLLMQIVLFTVGFVVVAITVFFSTRCMLPIMPIDTFPRDVTQALNLYYPRVKVTFDVTLFAIICLIDLFVLHRPLAVGIGTAISAFFIGRAVGLIHKWADKRVCFKKHLPI